jgi:hypothetical protein
VTVRTIIGLLASTGIRVGEALRLTVDDVRLDATPPHLYIHDTKFGKSRNVVLHPSTAANLQHYRHEREVLLRGHHAEPFFTNTLCRPLIYNPLRYTELIQIENGWRNAKEQRPGAVQRGVFREIETVAENPDAEPALPCTASKPAIIVYGKRVGTTITVCTDNHCPVHDPRAVAAQAANPAPAMAPATEAETEAEAEERKRNYEQQCKEYEQEQERRAEESRLDDERREKEWEAERARREKLQKARNAKFDRILENAPAKFTAAQLRVFLRALVNLDPYTFADDVAELTIWP